MNAHFPKTETRKAKFAMIFDFRISVFELADLAIYFVLL